MEDQLSLSMYDNILINIVRNAEEGVWKVINTEFEPLFTKWSEKDQDKRHKRLSQAWVKYLAYSLEDDSRKTMFNTNLFAYPHNPKTPNKSRIRCDEFSYSITLGNYYSFKSTVNSKTVWFKVQDVWQVESEFSNDMEGIAHDFSKLVTGNATFKMMVCSVEDSEAILYLTDMAQIAVHCYPELYLLLLNPLFKWYHEGKLNIQWQLYKWENHQNWWYLMESSKDKN